MEDAAAPDRKLQLRPLAWAVALLLALGFGACVAKGANGPEDPRLLGSKLQGFGEVSFTVEAPGDGLSTSQHCALLATTEQQLRQGLMEVTDLAGYAGMIFRFPSDSQSTFYMRNTPMPLSIAWFDADGRFVSATDMEPCPDQDGCPSYAAGGPYRYALEVPRGSLPGLGVGPGSVLKLGGPCPVVRG